MPEPEPEARPRPIPTTTTTTAAAPDHLSSNGFPRWSREGLTHASPQREQQQQQPPLMTMDLDLDLDLDAPWAFDQIFSSAPNNSCIGNFTATPFWLPEQPCSPLWAFSDDNRDDKPAGNVSGAAFYPRFVSYTVNQDSTAENPSEKEVEQKPSPPVRCLTPTDLPDGPCLIKQRMTQALRYFKESTQQHVLAQVWAPVKAGGRYVLTTSGQPFVLDPNSNGLHQYRMVSLMYKFSVDGETDEVLGLPGRVFRQKLPEWTPNVQYYSSKEFPRLDHALHYNVRGTLALPVFEPSGQSCVGVLELIMTSQKINYAPEVDKVCKALEAVNLKSSEILDQSNTQICNEGRQNALAEILEILTVVCETHKLPLAQTWVPCRHRSVLAYGGGLKKSCSSFDGSCMGQVCMSTTDVAFYVVDAHMWGFREACAEHHLQNGQGVAGRAFALRSACFCEDITQFCKTEYPLVHYARMFGLTSSFAICLRSAHTGEDDYILEFFLPLDINENRDQQSLLESLLVTMKPHFRSLKVASGKELEHEWRSIEIITLPTDKKLDSKPDSIRMSAMSPSGPALLTNGRTVHVDSSAEQHKVAGYNATNAEENIDCSAGAQNVVSGCLQETKVTGKKPERKRGKAEKTISLEVLQQYFSGSLKDAAKSLGVCPTTMKRICRQHGISRWPSRKINKVNRSLSKLKHVIESVQATEGAFTLTSLATSGLPVTVGPVSWSASPNDSNQCNSPVGKPTIFPEDKNESHFHKILTTDEVAECSNRMLGNEPMSLRNGFVLGDGLHQSKTGSDSREESTGTPPSQSSCHGTPGSGNESSPANNLVGSPVDDRPMEVGGSSVLASQPRGNLSAVFTTPDAFVSTQPQEPFGGMLIEDAGSSHDLRNLCPAGEGLHDERPPEHSWSNAPCSDVLRKDSNDSPDDKFSARPPVKTITIKATYKDDIIRFRLPSDSSILKLKEEVAKRLKLEQGTFDIKYLDDDHEWVLIACDADLQECIDISRSSNVNIIRLLVHDTMANPGSSCESSG